MFNNEIVSSDKFLDMAISTQCLYFHLCMNADDDWFVSPKRIMRMIWSTDDELRVLAMKWFVLAFNDGVIVITHWKLNNNEIKLDRYNKTIYQEHLQTLTQYNKVYALELVGVQNVVQMEDQSRVDKSRLDKNRVENIIPPTEDFENFWKLFPHARKWKRKEAMQMFSKLSSAEVMQEVKLLNWRIEVWLQNPQYIPACERRIRDFTKTSPILMEQLFEAMIHHLKKFEWEDRHKLSRRMKLEFWDDIIKEKRNIYGGNWWIILKFKDDSWKITTF